MTTAFFRPSVLSFWFYLVSMGACGGKSSTDRSWAAAGGTVGTELVGTGARSQTPDAAGGTGGSSVTPSDTANHVESSNGGTTALNTSGVNVVCPANQRTQAPEQSTDCTIAVRKLDPSLTCGDAKCAVTKALDLTCSTFPEAPQLHATSEGAILLVRTRNEGENDVVRLMTVQAEGNSVVDFRDLVGASASSSTSPRGAFAARFGGAKWFFSGSPAGITAVRRTDAGWLSSDTVSSPGLQGTPILGDATMVNDTEGYLTYFSQQDHVPRLAAWNGTCWLDKRIGDPSVETMVVAADAEKRPWVVSLALVDGASKRLIRLRHPDGVTEELDFESTMPSFEPVSVLLGGLDGASKKPAVAARFWEGIRIITPKAGSDKEWRLLRLPESAGETLIATDCPSSGPSQPFGTLCAGRTTCDEGRNTPGNDFGLVRTASGAVFASWINYTSSASYALAESSDPSKHYCLRTELSGTGTAELTVARLTDTQPVLTRFRFGMSSSVESPTNELSMVARDDTLVVAAYLSGQLTPTLTYLEIDSKLLP